MRKLYQFITVICICAFTVNAFRAGAVGKQKIIKIAFNSEHLFIYADAWNNANECQQSDAVILERGSTNFDKAYTMILAAFMAGRDISAYSDGCLEWDGKTYNTIRAHKYLTVY